MPRQARRMTPKEVRALKGPGPEARSPRFIAVGGVAGLQIQISPTGARSWVLQCSIGGKSRAIGIGSYADLTLDEARQEARTLRNAIRAGHDPIQERRDARRAAADAITFATAAERCYQVKSAEWKDGPRKQDWLRSLQRHAHPHIGDKPVADVDLHDLLRVLEPIWREKTEVAKAVRQRIEHTLEWARVRGYREGENPARWRNNLDRVLPNPSKIHKTRHHPALAWDRAPGFVGELRQREGMAARALEFAILTAARSGEVRNAEWAEVDFDGKLWTVPAERTKTGRPHRVPLSDDAIELLKALPRREGSPYVFPAPRRGQPLSDMTLSALCRRMDEANVNDDGAGWRDPTNGAVATPHGIARSSFKDWARSRTSYADEVSELALGHVNSDATRTAYARDELLPKRKKLMESWAKFIREGAAKASVTSIGEARNDD